MSRARRRLSHVADRWLLPVAVLAFHLATARGYGIFRDELYYLACGDHLAFGYVDHPPLVALLARAVRATLGASLPALRFLPAVAAAATTWFAIGIARELGGGRWARWYAGIATALAPVYLSLFSILSMNAFDVLAWTVCAWLFVRLLAGAPRRHWLVFGAVFGAGLQNKISMLFLGFGLVTGLVVARRWDLFRRREFWLGWCIALALFLPHIAWQVAHGWPTLEFMENARRYKMTAPGPGPLLGELALHAGPLSAMLAIAGIAWYLLAPAARRWRPLGWTAVAVIVLLAAARSKPYYVAPVYAFLFAAGGVALAAVTPGRTLRPLRWLCLLLLVAGGVLTAPIAKPLLPVETFVRYSRAAGIRPDAGERHEQGRLPQFFADMFGWRDLAETVAGVYRSLPEEERRATAIFAQNYGEAGAIDFFGRELGLPRALSGHNSYFLWGPGAGNATTVIVIGGDRRDLEREFEQVMLATTFRCRDCMPYENDNPIWLARGPRRSLREIWPGVKKYI